MKIIWNFFWLNPTYTKKYILTHDPVYMYLSVSLYISLCLYLSIYPFSYESIYHLHTDVFNYSFIDNSLLFILFNVVSVL